MKSRVNKIDSIEIIIEKSEGLLWGRVEDKGNFIPTPYGKNAKELVENLKELVADYVAHEGKKDVRWNKIDWETTNITFAYDLEAYFHEHDYLKISAIAEQAGMNPGLLRQYASGVKYPSAEQAEKIQNAIKNIAEQLLSDAIYVA